MTGLSRILKDISTSWNNAVTEQFTNHPIAQKIRKELPDSIRAIIEDKYPDLNIKSSAGAGNWANVPWLSILDPRITTTTQEGVYPAYLFKADGTGVYLSLNQGTTNPSNLFGKRVYWSSFNEVTLSRFFQFCHFLHRGNVTKRGM